jgi:hypothetical protein
MKKTILSLVSILAITLGANAEQVEFRLLTLRGEIISDKRIKDLLLDGGLGLEQCYIVTIKEGRFTFDDTREIRYPTEFSKDGVVTKKGIIKLGATIVGKATRTGSVRSLDFDLNYCEKKGDQVNTFRDGVAFVTPVFTKFGVSSKWVSEKEDDSWTIMKISNPDETVNQYLTFRLK